jgi:hypothetical protein
VRFAPPRGPIATKRLPALVKRCMNEDYPGRNRLDMPYSISQKSMDSVNILGKVIEISI